MGHDSNLPIVQLTSVEPDKSVRLCKPRVATKYTNEETMRKICDEIKSYYKDHCTQYIKTL